MGEATDVDALIHGTAHQVRLQAGTVVAGVAVASIARTQPEQGLLVATAVAIDRHRDHRASSLLGACHEGLGDLPFVGGVELIPDRRAAGGGDVLGRAGAASGEYLQVITDLGGLGGRDLAVLMESLLAA